MLIVALIMLLLVTLMAVSGMRGTSLEERMAGNLRDQNVAFLAAEAALRAGETRVGKLNTLDTSESPCPSGKECLIYSETALADIDLATKGADWWTTDNNTIEYVPEPDANGTTTVPWKAAPRYVVEDHHLLRDTLRRGHEYYEGGKHILQITARGTGQTDDAEVRVQSTYAKRFND